MTIHTQIQSGTAAAPPPELRGIPQPVRAELVEASSFSPGGTSVDAKKDGASTGSAQTGLDSEAENHFRAALDILEITHTDTTHGWTPQRQSHFLAAIADGATVQDAAQEVGLSRRSAYAFRRTARGTAFKFGWQAAEILAADSLREDLWDRARNGQSWTVVRDDGERTVTTTRHRFDNRLALSMLTRLEARVTEGTHPTATRLANRFDTFLDVLETGATPADARDLIARVEPPKTGIGTCEPCESPDGDAAENLVVWYDCDQEEWFTTLPVPLDFDGEEFGRSFDGDYFRTLTDDEQIAVAHFVPEECELPLHPIAIAAEARRTAWFAAARHATHPRDVVVGTEEESGATPLPLAGGDDSPGASEAQQVECPPDILRAAGGSPHLMRAMR